MPKLTANVLTAVAVKNAKPGRYGDGGSLYLLVKPTGSRFWLFRYKANGKAREMGLGTASGTAAVSLAAAREKASDLLRIVKAGGDPLETRRSDAVAAVVEADAARIKAITFRDVAELYVAAHEETWRNAKHREQWGSTLKKYVYPYMGDEAVSVVSTAHVMAALEPIWMVRPETATRVRGRIEVVLDYARSRGWRSGENPARWRGHVANLLPPRGKVAQVVHHAALPWREIGSFMITLRQRRACTARALEFTILTVARTGEVIGAKWSEIDLEHAVWTVPGARMKAGREHRVPLSVPAMAVLAEMTALRPEDDVASISYIFPGARVQRPLSQMSMLMLLRRLSRPDLTAHGFRSTFRDWCAEATSYSGDVAEAALAHTIGNKVEAAYRRGDLFEKRRSLMEEWALFCQGSAAGQIVDVQVFQTDGAASDSFLAVRDGEKPVSKRTRGRPDPDDAVAS